MARVDYEAAWDELLEKVLTREGWGTKNLIAEMAHLRVKHRVSEGLWDRFLRLYGSRLLALADNLPGGSSSARGGMPAAGRDGHRTTEGPEEDHDGDEDGARGRTKLAAAG